MVVGELLTLTSKSEATGPLEFRLALRSGGRAIAFAARLIDGSWTAYVDTSALKAGVYHWELWKLSPANVVARGAFTLEPSVGAANPKTAREVLQMIDATLEGLASDGVQSFTINGRSLSKFSVKELLDLRAIYVTKAKNELAAAGQFKGQQWGYQF